MTTSEITELAIPATLSPPLVAEHRPAETTYRVAIVSTQPRWHGGEVQAFLLASGLRQRGHACLIVARADGQFARRAQDDGFAVATFAGRGRSPWALWKIRRELRAFCPDIVHYNDPHAVRAAGVASSGLAVPVRVAARRVDFRLRSVASYRAFCDSLICVSRAVSQVCRAGGFPADQLHVVHDGVDPTRMYTGDRDRGRDGLGLSEDQRLLLTVAKLTDHKGHRFLLDALPRVVRRHPETVVAFAGDGKLRGPLQRQVRQLGLEHHVRFLGYRSDVPDLMAAADLLIVPSHMEGLCSSIIDAMLIGCPVVGTDAGGIPDLLGDPSPQEARYGWMVPPRDPPAMAAALLEALDSPQVARVRAENARRRALQDFTHESMVEQTLCVYSQLMPLAT